MTKQVSYTKFEQALLPEFRDKIDRAESTEEAKKFFNDVALALLEKIFEEKGAIRYEEVSLDPDAPEGFTFADSLKAQERFQQAWADSDLPRIMSRLAQSAINRYRHLEKNPAKTHQKIFHDEGKR